MPSFSNLRPFQIVLLGIFAGFFLIGLIFVSLFRGLYTDVLPYGESVVIWGIFDRHSVETIIGEIRDDDKEFKVVEYVEKDPRTFDNQLLTAIAEGRSPDLIILPHNSLVMHRGKLLPISFETFTERNFRDTYIDGAEIFLRSDGIYGIPFAVDPMVMYWNKDILSTSGLALPPATWEELVHTVVPAVTEKNSSHDIFQSTVSFGEYKNVTHAKRILSMLMLQSGSSIVEENDRGYEITLRKKTASQTFPADASLSFYTQFAIPSNLNYNWNRALPNDKQQFLGGELALYFAQGSEYEDLRRGNPNLNFDTALVPQGSGATTFRNYGDFYAFAIPKASSNMSGAYKAARKLTSQTAGPRLAANLEMVPVIRSVIAKGTSDSHEKILYATALVSRGWLDPDPSETEEIFEDMIEDVTAGRQRISGAVVNAIGRLRLLFN